MISIPQYKTTTSSKSGVCRILHTIRIVNIRTHYSVLIFFVCTHMVHTRELILANTFESGDVKASSLRRYLQLQECFVQRQSKTICEAVNVRLFTIVITNPTSQPVVHPNIAHICTAPH